MYIAYWSQESWKADIIKWSYRSYVLLSYGVYDRSDFWNHFIKQIMHIRWSVVSKIIHPR